METPNLFLFFSNLLLLTFLSGGEQFVQSLTSGDDHRNRLTDGSVLAFRPNKLFVFGDSYADTGNIGKSQANSWKFPYGITFPGKPAGRFSDGRVSTDYIAKYLKIKTPIPYRWRKELNGKLKYGMNFAYGGTGEFNTFALLPNMTTQIDFLEQLLNDSVYTKRELKSSVAVMSVAGNDYSTYINTNGSVQGLPYFIRAVVDQIAINMKRIHKLGVRKVAVNSLQPLGCLPRSAINLSFQHCNATENALVVLHNSYLNQTINKLNAETNSTANNFVILDLDNAFWTVFSNKTFHKGDSTFDPYKPCCVGISSEYSCGSVDRNGTEMYTLCADAESRFFWDMVHPTQQGWHAVYSTPAMQKSLEQL